MRPNAYSYLRMSTEQQLKGDSLRRQMEASRKYAEEHELLLVDSLQDIGVSAYKGKNRTQGALRQFSDLVEAGRIERGSYLLLESLDRLSREQVRQALPFLLSLVSAGIKVVTLCDGKVYDENVDDMDLMYSLIIMSRSHDESRMKSQRVKAAWENKRRRMHELPMTANCPGWLKLDKSKGVFEVIPERAAVVRRIFDESLAGLGRNVIAKGLNRDGVPPFSSRGRGWHPGTVQKVRHNPAVLGYLPVNGNQRSGVSEDRAGYYPQIISPEEFHRVQALVAGRRRKGGRRGTRFTNLFQHLCFCGVCGSPMTVVSRGSGIEKMYACDAHVRGFGCAHATYHKVRWLEEAVFSDVFSSVDYSRFDKGQDALAKAEGERAALVARLEEKRDRANLLLEKFGPDSDVELITAHVTKLNGEIKALESKLAQADQTLSHLRHDNLSLRQRVSMLRELKASLETAAEEEVYRIRSAINQQLRAAMERVLFFPNRSVQVHLPGEYQQMRVMPSGIRLWAHCL